VIFNLSAIRYISNNLNVKIQAKLIKLCLALQKDILALLKWVEGYFP
jgi:hypothetical protein